MLILSSWVFLDCFISQVSCFVSNAEEIGAYGPFIVLRTQLHILVDNHAFCQLQMCMYLMIVCFVLVYYLHPLWMK